MAVLLRGGYAGTVEAAGSASLAFGDRAQTSATANDSIAFGNGGDLNSYIGGFDALFLNGVTMDTAHSLLPGIPEFLWVSFQLTFAIITPALITGAFAERLKYSGMLLFTALWSLVVYAPIAHWVWGGGFLGDWGVLDYAGGTVVHINAGIAAVIADGTYDKITAGYFASSIYGG